MLEPHWEQKNQSTWYSFHHANLTEDIIKDVIGIFCVFKAKTEIKDNKTILCYKTILIDTGNISEKIKDLQENETLKKYRPLYITWAKIENIDQLEGIKKCLKEKLKPCETELDTDSNAKSFECGQKGLEQELESPEIASVDTKPPYENLAGCENISWS